MSLSTELRCLIYRYLFQNVEFLVDVPYQRSGTEPQHLELVGRLLPNILLVSKRVRAEALPAFSRIIEPVFCNYADYPEACIIPDHHLRHVTKITLADEDTAIPPVQQMPQLEEITMLVHKHLLIRPRTESPWPEVLPLEMLEERNILLETYSEFCRRIEIGIGVGCTRVCHH